MTRSPSVTLPAVIRQSPARPAAALAVAGARVWAWPAVAAARAWVRRPNRAPAAHGAAGARAGGGGGAASFGAPAAQGAPRRTGGCGGARRSGSAGRSARGGRRLRHRALDRMVVVVHRDSGGCRGQRRAEQEGVASSHFLANPSRPKKGRSQMPASDPTKAAANHSQPCRLPDAMPENSAPILQPKERRAP